MNYPFFWDTIQLASKHAHYFYETNFTNIILPKDIDSGHIPTLGIYLAFIWKIFGKNLIASHLAMLPFVLGIVYQSILLTKKLFNSKWQIKALFILLIDSTLLAQCTLISPDVLLIFFFLMALNYFINGKRLLYAIALSGLVLASTRGMMCVAALFLAEIINNWFQNEAFSKNKTASQKFKYIFSFSYLNGLKGVLTFLPAIIIAGSFLSWHYFKTGWIGYHKDMPWSTLFEMVNFKGFIRNIFILGWRLTDFGRLFIWIAGVYCAWDYYKHRPKFDTNFKVLLTIFICILMALSQAVLLHTGLSGHRYLLPVYLLFALLVSCYLFEYSNNIKMKNILFGIILVGLLTGNFWVYPDKIAKGWDSCLSYLPYFHLREKMMDYMKGSSISFDETGTTFPNLGPFENTDLSNSTRSFAALDLKTNNYVFYSNIFNDFSDAELLELNTKWQKLQEYKLMQVRVTLFKKP
jgi:hypothetical protein